MEEADAKEILDQLVEVEEALTRARSALRKARRIGEKVRGPIGIPLTEDERAKTAEAHRMSDIMVTLLNLMAAMIGPSQRWVTTEQAVIAARGAGLTDEDARSALMHLNRSGTIYNPGGKDTWAPLERTLV